MTENLPDDAGPAVPETAPAAQPQDVVTAGAGPADADPAGATVAEEAAPDDAPADEFTPEGGHNSSRNAGGDAEGPHTVAAVEDEEGARQNAEPLPAAHRRAPRYGRFITVGILLAGVVAFIGALLSAGQSEYQSSDIFWVLVIWFVPLGILGGALTALALDRRSITKADRQFDDPVG